MTIAEMRAKQADILAKARAKLEEIKDETPAERAAEIQAEHDRAMTDYDALEGRVARQESMDEREAALNLADARRPTGADRNVRSGEVDTRTPVEKRQAAFRSFLSKGREGLTNEERAALNVESRAQMVGQDTAGGYLVPDQFQAELIKTLKAWGPMMDPGVTRMISTATGATMTWPTMDDTSNTGALIGENQQVSLTEVKFGTRSLDAYKYTSGVVLVSDEIVNDEVLGIESIIQAAMAERIGRIGNLHLTTGDGASKPNGIVTAASAGFTAASSTAIVFDDMFELQHSVDPAYRSDPSVRWMFNDSTLKALRKLKDGEGRYIWQPADVKTGAPATILDNSFVINQAVASIATGARSVTYGAMNRYIVRLVAEFMMKRLVERYADFGQVGFIGFTRLDGELMDTSAIKALTHP
jgi:HK97 family phage major capsid protein